MTNLCSLTSQRSSSSCLKAVSVLQLVHSLWEPDTLHGILVVWRSWWWKPFPGSCLFSSRSNAYHHFAEVPAFSAICLHYPAVSSGLFELSGEKEGGTALCSPSRSWCDAWWLCLQKYECDVWWFLMALSPNHSCHQVVPYLSLVVCLAERAGRLYLCLFFSVLIYQCLVLPIFHLLFQATSLSGTC